MAYRLASIPLGEIFSLTRNAVTRSRSNSGRRCLAVKTSRIQYLDAVIILVELHRTVTGVISVTYGIHHELSRSPIRIIDKIVFAQCADRYGAAVGYRSLDECIQFAQNLAEIAGELVFCDYLSGTATSAETDILDVCTAKEMLRILAEENDACICGTIVFRVVEAQSLHFILDATLVAFVYIVGNRLGKIVVLENLLVEVVKCRSETRGSIEGRDVGCTSITTISPSGILAFSTTIEG